MLSWYQVIQSNPMLGTNSIYSKEKSGFTVFNVLPFVHQALQYMFRILDVQVFQSKQTNARAVKKLSRNGFE